LSEVDVDAIDRQRPLLTDLGRLRWPASFGQFGGPNKLITDHHNAANGRDNLQRLGDFAFLTCLGQANAGVWAKGENFSLRLKVYRMRHSLLPVGVTNSTRPPVSVSLYARSFGLAALTPASVSTAISQSGTRSLSGRYPAKYPPTSVSGQVER
jgi:hypothetical protein